jgi:two-component system, NarL family, sensor kinase
VSEIDRVKQQVKDTCETPNIPHNSGYLAIMQPDSNQFLLMFAVASIGMLMLAGSIVLFVVFYQKRMLQEQFKRQALVFDHQQKMMQAELESQESERRKLAADLHDSIGGMLSTIRVGLTTAARALPNPQSIDETKQMLDDTISSVRRISRDLMPSTLEKFGLTHAIRELCERFAATSKIEIKFSENGDLQKLDSQRELMIYRIAQELLNNAIKHSQASLIEVTLTNSDKIGLTVEDNGVGFDADYYKNDISGNKGLGLYSIENRTRLLAGEITFTNKKPKGSKTILIAPLAHEKTT